MAYYTLLVLNDGTWSPEFGDGCEDDPLPGTWDCVDPCAMLIVLADSDDLKCADVRETLEAYGWIDPETGKVDTARAERLANRV